MTFTDAIGGTTALGTDKVAAKGGAVNHNDQLQQYRLPESLTKTPNTAQHSGENQRYLDLSESPTRSAKPLSASNDSSHSVALSMEEIKKKINTMMQHASDSSAPLKPAESSSTADRPLQGHFVYDSQPVYGADSKAIGQSVEKYGSKLDYHQKQNLDDMISSTALGQTDKLKDALQKSTPEARNAYAEVMRKEMGLNVTLDNKANGGYDLNVYDKSGTSKIEMSQDEQFATAKISSGWENGKAPMFANPWIMSEDRQTVNHAMDNLSDNAAKYRVQVGETR
jgi:hypothetical protein